MTVVTKKRIILFEFIELVLLSAIIDIVQAFN